MSEEQGKHKDETASVYRIYLDNSRRSEALQSEIIKGAKEGENIYGLFLKACQAISLMTGSQVFYSQVETSVKAVYGEALREQAPLEVELHETEARLEKLRAAEQEAEEQEIREGIQHAIRNHQNRIDRLKRMIEEIKK